SLPLKQPANHCGGVLSSSFKTSPNASLCRYQPQRATALSSIVLCTGLKKGLPGAAASKRRTGLSPDLSPSLYTATRPRLGRPRRSAVSALIASLRIPTLQELTNPLTGLTVAVGVVGERHFFIQRYIIQQALHFLHNQVGIGPHQLHRTRFHSFR